MIEKSFENVLKIGWFRTYSKMQYAVCKCYQGHSVMLNNCLLYHFPIPMNDYPLEVLKFGFVQLKLHDLQKRALSVLQNYYQNLI